MNWKDTIRKEDITLSKEIADIKDDLVKIFMRFAMSNLFVDNEKSIALGRMQQLHEISEQLKESEVLKMPFPNLIPARRKQMEKDSFNDLYPNEQLSRHAVKQLFEQTIDPGLERAVQRNQNNFELPLDNHESVERQFGMQEETLLKWLRKMYKGYRNISIPYGKLMFDMA